MKNNKKIADPFSANNSKMVQAYEPKAEDFVLKGITADEMIDEKCNRGLFTEFVYFCSNLVFSSSDEQVRNQ